MIAGFYSSAAGMLSQIEHQDVIASNLSNSNTSGYKRQAVSFSAFSTELADAAGRLSAGGCTIPVAFAQQDSGQGILEDTSNPTNLAIDGPGFFVISAPGGRQLTRSGNFRLDQSGLLVTNEGNPVMGQNGPIRLSGTDWSVDPDGTIRVAGSPVDRLRIELPPGARGLQPGRVVQGRLESSNVKAVQEMASMITALRAYEANQRMIQSLDQTLDKAINQMGSRV